MTALEQEDEAAVNAIRDAVRSVNQALSKAYERGITAESSDLIDISTVNDNVASGRRKILTLHLERKVFGDIVV